MRGIAHKNEKPVLFVLTSHTRLGESMERTGFRFEALAIPYYQLHDTDLFVDIASIEGGAVHPDPQTYDKEHRDANPGIVTRFVNDPEAMYKMQSSLKIGDRCRAESFRGIYLVGGYGALWDFPENKELQRLIGEAFALGLPIASLGHGAAGLLNVKVNNEYIIDGYKITATTNDEEYRSGRRDVIPFLIENRLRSRGAHFVYGAHSFATEDAPFITGQNMASAEMLGEKLRGRVQEMVDQEEAA